MDVIIVDDTELEQLQGIYTEMDANGKKRMLSIAENLLNAQKVASEEDPVNSKIKGREKK